MQKIILAVTIGVASIAAVAGFLISLKPIPDASVVAAVITGLLGLILGGSAIFIHKSEIPSSALIWAWGAFVFGVMFVGTLFVSRIVILPDKQDTLSEDLFSRQEIHFIYLQECSAFQFKINEDRKKLNLPPLSNELVCRELLP